MEEEIKEYIGNRVNSISFYDDEVFYTSAKNALYDFVQDAAEQKLEDE